MHLQVLARIHTWTVYGGVAGLREDGPPLAAPKPCRGRPSHGWTKLSEISVDSLPMYSQVVILAGSRYREHAERRDIQL